MLRIVQLYGGGNLLDSAIRIMIKDMSIKTRSDGRLEGRLMVNGKRKSFYGSTKAEVKINAKNYLQKVENGYCEPKKITLNDYIEYWLKTYKENKIEPTSYSRLYSVWLNQIHDTIGMKMIGDIETKDIQKIIDNHAIPPSDDIKAFTLTGLKRIVHLLRPCLKRAVDEGVIYQNPCNNVILPVASCVVAKSKEQFSLSDAEIEKFKQAALLKKKSGEYRARDGIVLVFLLNTGLRVGELDALEWDDIDLGNNIVKINKTVQSNIVTYDGEKRVQYSRVKASTKTNAGMRILPLNETALWCLNELKRYDMRNHIQSPYICCTRNGTRVNVRNLQRSMDRILQYTDIDKKITLHTLRHTFGSTLLRRGIGIEVVSKLLGHANVKITYLKYIHTVQEEEAKAMKLVNL